MRIFLIIFFFFSSIPFIFSQKEIAIHFVPSLQHIHKVNPNYSYDTLKTVIYRLKPDYIMVEIRDEDIDRDTAYLKRNYPSEMWAMQFWFSKVPVFGIDWLGKELAGKPIPENYWKESAAIKKWENELQFDIEMQQELEECDGFAALRIPLLKEGTFEELTNGDDEKLTLKYYQCLERKFFGTKHARVTDFYKTRNFTMAERITQVVSENGRGTYAVVAGADRIPFLKMYLYRLGAGGFIK